MRLTTRQLFVLNCVAAAGTPTYKENVARIAYYPQVVTMKQQSGVTRVLVGLIKRGLLHNSGNSPFLLPTYQVSLTEAGWRALEEAKRG